MALSSPDRPSPRGLRPEPAPAFARDTDATPFAEILRELIERVPGSYAAALVDSEGETVDYSGCGQPFDLRVAAAHLQLVVQSLRRFSALGEPRWVVVRGNRKSVAATSLPDGYVLAVLLRPRAAFTISTRALTVCTRALALEAGWRDAREGGTQRTWFSATVETDARGRPIFLGPARVPLEVLGAIIGLPARERGFRVRTQGGTELSLVRETGHRWYADEPT